MNKSQIVEPLKLSKSALGTSSIIPGVDSFYFEGKRVVAFNGSLAIVANLENDFPTTGFVAGQPLFKLLNELPDEIELSSSEGNLLIKAGSSKSKFPISALNGCLFKEPTKSAADQQLPTSAMFSAGLKKVMLSLSDAKSSDLKEIGISLFIEAGECELYATNNITLSKYKFTLGENETKRNISTFLPAQFAENYNFLSSELLACPDEVAISKEFIRAVFNKVSLFCSFYTTDAKQSIKTQFNSAFDELKMIPLPKGMGDAIRRCSVIAGDSAVVELHYTPTALNVSAKGIGEIRDSLPMEYSSEGKLNIGIKYLQQILDLASKIGFGSTFIGLEGSDVFFQHLINSRS